MQTVPAIGKENGWSSRATAQNNWGAGELESVILGGSWANTFQQGALWHPVMQLGVSTQGIPPWLTVAIIYTKHLKQFQNITHSFGFQTSEASQKRFLSSSALSRSVLCRFFDLPIDQLWHK